MQYDNFWQALKWINKRSIYHTNITQFYALQGVSPYFLPEVMCCVDFNINILVISAISFYQQYFKYFLRSFNLAFLLFFMIFVLAVGGASS